jgi:hypothetical protein
VLYVCGRLVRNKFLNALDKPSGREARQLQTDTGQQMRNVIGNYKKAVGVEMVMVEASSLQDTIVSKKRLEVRNCLTSEDWKLS